MAEGLLKPPCVNGDDMEDRLVAVSQSLRKSAEGVEVELSVRGPLAGKDEAEAASVPGSFPRKHGLDRVAVSEGPASDSSGSIR